MSQQGKKLGQAGERLATNLLTAKKFKILSRNLRTKFGEIDILARDPKGPLVIVEVKTKTSEKFGSAAEMITRAKKEKLILLAHELQMKHQTPSVRIDVVTVDNAATTPALRHYPGIVEYNA